MTTPAPAVSRRNPYVALNVTVLSRNPLDQITSTDHGRAGASIRAFVESTGGVRPPPWRRSSRHICPWWSGTRSRGVAADESLQTVAARLGRSTTRHGRATGGLDKPSTGCHPPRDSPKRCDDPLRRQHICARRAGRRGPACGLSAGVALCAADGPVDPSVQFRRRVNSPPIGSAVGSHT